MTRASLSFRGTYGLLAVMLCMLGTAVAHADFIHALIDYKEGKFPEASAQFMELAALGDAGSQFNLGAMSLRGEGVPKNKGAGVGWLLASAENGSTQIALAPPRAIEFSVSA